MNQLNESERIKIAYQKRKDKGLSKKYSLYNKANIHIVQERERVQLSMLENTIGSLTDKRILDIGCGWGGTLKPFLFYGAKMDNCYGIDILQDRITKAKNELPQMHFECCSAKNTSFPGESFDLVTMFTCLSSILDDNIRAGVCRKALEMLKPDGWVLVYDFRVNNPNNKDVRAVRLNELREYFSGCDFISKRLTLLPPLARRIAPVSTLICSLLEFLPFLKTHRMTMFQKPANNKG